MKFQIKRGDRSDLPTLSVGEFGLTTDEKKLYIGTGSGNRQLVDALEFIEELEKKADKASVPNPNFLINPNFRINQRRKTVYTGTGYTVDMWSGITSGVVAQPVSNGIKVAMGVSSPANSSCAIASFIPFDRMRDLRGKNATFSCDVVTIASSGTAMNIASMKNGVYGALGHYLISETGRIAVAIPKDADMIRVALYGADPRQGDSIGDYTIFAWAKLERGSIATPFVPPAPTLELSKCQRYLINVNNHSFVRTRAISVTSNTIDFFINTPAMSHTNGVLVYDSLTYSISNFNGGTVHSSGFTFATIAGVQPTNGFLLRAIKINHGLLDAFINIAPQSVAEAGIFDIIISKEL